jgi:hypothetical protein
LFEVVPHIIQLGAIRSHDIAVEIDFFAVWRLSRRISTYWRPFELDNRTRIVDHLLALGEGVGVYVPSRRAAYAKCNQAQGNRREYQQCSEDFFHSFWWFKVQDFQGCWLKIKPAFAGKFQSAAPQNGNEIVTALRGGVGRSEF